MHTLATLRNVYQAGSNANCCAEDSRTWLPQHTQGEQQQQQPQPDENSNNNNNNNKGYCLVAPVDCSSAHREYRSCCAANRRRLCSTWPNCQRYPSLPPRPYPQHPWTPPPLPHSSLSDDRLLHGDRLIDDLFILIG